MSMEHTQQNKKKVIQVKFGNEKKNSNPYIFTKKKIIVQVYRDTLIDTGPDKKIEQIRQKKRKTRSKRLN